MAGWQVATGGGKPNPYWVYRGQGASTEYIKTDKGNVRRFKSMANAQRAADKLNREHYLSVDVKSAKGHVTLAIRHLLKATDGAQPDDARLDIITGLYAAWHALNLTSTEE